MNMPFLTHNAWLPAFLPLLAGTLIFIFAAFQRQNKALAMGLSLTGTALALLASLGLLFSRMTQPEILLHGKFRWLTTGAFDLNLSWSVDNLSAMMLVVVTFVSLLVQIYSAEYMAHEEGVPRYYGALSLFTCSMLLLVLADNLLLMFVGWEGVGLCSYLLIGFWFYHKPKQRL